jgi:hypothetical protein
MTKLEKLRHRALYAPHGERAKRQRALRDETRRQLGYTRALKRVQRRRAA